MVTDVAQQKRSNNKCYNFRVCVFNNASCFFFCLYLLLFGYLFSLVLCTSTFITQCFGLLFRQQLHDTTQGDELNLIIYLVDL